MRPRLFWKILGAFWLTLVLATAGVIVTVMILTRPPGGGFVQRLEAERLRAAAVALHYGGEPALSQVIERWPEEDRARLLIEHGPNGVVKLSMRPPSPASVLSMWPLAVLLGAGLVFSAALAVYLARPIGVLRKGFGQLAQGDLDVRLTPGMGRRRDEIADLARDFDRMAERLQQLIASRDRLLHDVSHELRSPLARLSLAVELARKNGAPNDPALARIEAEAARLNTLVGDLLSLARAESETSAEQIYYDIASLLHVVGEDARFEAQPRGVNVSLKIAPVLEDPSRAPLLVGAPELLRRAVENVVRNAMRFSPAGSAVTISAAIEAGVIVIEVRDVGPGVPAAMLATMFDPFVKGVGEARGVGLGLAIAQRALAAHSGDVRAYNLDTGGLLVRMTLPIATQAKPVLAS